jgi:hypothetical protein
VQQICLLQKKLKDIFMKKISLFLFFTTCFLLMRFTGLAQHNKDFKEQAPEGFWVIESHAKTPKESVVSFYTAGQFLIYEEKISSKKAKLFRAKTVRSLNKTLQQCIAIWDRQQKMKAESRWPREQNEQSFDR